MASDSTSHETPWYDAVPDTITETVVHYSWIVIKWVFTILLCLVMLAFWILVVGGVVVGVVKMVTGRYLWEILMQKASPGTDTVELEEGRKPENSSDGYSEVVA